MQFLQPKQRNKVSGDILPKTSVEHYFPSTSPQQPKCLEAALLGERGVAYLQNGASIL